MSRLESIKGDNWESFINGPAAVLVLGKTDCAGCNQWSEELVSGLETDTTWQHVRFGKLLLDTPGLASFKRANAALLSEVDNLPFTIIYKQGEVQKTFVGGGFDRLLRRLEKVIPTPS